MSLILVWENWISNWCVPYKHLLHIANYTPTSQNWTISCLKKFDSYSYNRIPDYLKTKSELIFMKFLGKLYYRINLIVLSTLYQLITDYSVWTCTPRLIFVIFALYPLHIHFTFLILYTISEIWGVSEKAKFLISSCIQRLRWLCQFWLWCHSFYKNFASIDENHIPLYFHEYHENVIFYYHVYYTNKVSHWLIHIV